MSRRAALSWFARRLPGSLPGRIAAAALCALCLPGAGRACDTALLLSIDVSSSIDLGEYRLQVDGMADALTDPDIVAALVQGRMALAVVQWSGVGNQMVMIDWERMTSPAAVASFSQRSRALPRAYVNSDTAIGDAIAFSARRFEAVQDCTRRVIDISGDGVENSGGSTAGARARAERQGIVINGIAIESLGVAVTGFFRSAVITTDGFVLTARGYRDYPEAIRQKIAREVVSVTG